MVSLSQDDVSEPVDALTETNRPKRLLFRWYSDKTPRRKDSTEALRLPGNCDQKEVAVPNMAHTLLPRPFGPSAASVAPRDTLVT